MDFYNYVNEHSQAIIDELKALCKIESVLDAYNPKREEAPFGEGIQAALDHMLNRAKKDGFVIKNIKNHAAHIEHGDGEALLGILCHLDVVPPGEGWSHPPFQPTIKEGKLFARGSMDDKGPTIAAYFALKFLKDLDVTFKKRVRIILGTDEETAWRGIGKYFETEEKPTLGFAPDASFPLIYAEKGMLNFDIEGSFYDDDLITFHAGERYNVVPDRAWCTLKRDLKTPFKNFLKYYNFKGEIQGDRYIVHGKNAHAMQPHLGVNAGFVLAKFLSEHIDNPFIKVIQEKLSFDAFGEKLGIDYTHDEMKAFTINPGVFQYDENGSLIGINCRYPKSYPLKKNTEKIKTVLNAYGLIYQEKQNLPVHYVDKNTPLVETLMKAYRKVTNDTDSEPFTIGGGTYARALGNAVAFGMLMPGRDDVVHQVDEHVYIDDLIEATAVYMEAIYELTRQSN